MKSLEELCTTILNAHLPDVGFGHARWDESKNKSIRSFEAAENAIKELSEHPKKEDAVPALVSGNGLSDIRSDALKAVGTRAALHGLIQLFQTARDIDRSHIADHIASFDQKMLLQELSKQDLEQIVLSGFENSLNETYAPLLGHLATPDAVKNLLHMIFQTHRPQSYRDHAITALKKSGPRINDTLLEKLAMTWVREEKQTQDVYRKDLLKILEHTGDKTCLDKIQELAENDPVLENNAVQTLQAISKRLNLPVCRTFTGATLKEAENKIRQDLPQNIHITDKQALEEKQRFVTIQAFDISEAESQARCIPLGDMEKYIDLTLQTKGSKGILGMGRKKSSYLAKIRKDARITITYTF